MHYALIYHSSLKEQGQDLILFHEVVTKRQLVAELSYIALKNGNIFCWAIKPVVNIPWRVHLAT